MVHQLAQELQTPDEAVVAAVDMLEVLALLF
jgi:hypothetical protein